MALTGLGCGLDAATIEMRRGMDSDMDIFDKLLPVAFGTWHSQYGTLRVRSSVKVCGRSVMIWSSAGGGCYVPVALP